MERPTSRTEPAPEFRVLIEQFEFLMKHFAEGCKEPKCRECWRFSFARAALLRPFK